MVEHLAYFLPDTAYGADDWRNVDSLAQPGVDEVVNLFEYPWPWADNSVSEIWCSHIIEHIPHAATIRPFEATPGLRKAAASDGFYAWFYEAWRVLKPGGVIHIVTPYGLSIAGMSDPQHTRYITPETFGYLAPQSNDSAPFDYQVPLHFAALRDATLAHAPANDPAVDDQPWYHVNAIREVAISLKAVKLAG